MTTTPSGFDAAAVDALTAEDLRARGGLKWTFFPDAIGAWVAEMDFPLAAPIARALEHAISTPSIGYLSGPFGDAARSAVAGWYERETGWAPPREGIHLVPDVLAALRITLDSIAGPGATAVVTTPAYMPFLTRPQAIGHRLETAAAYRDDTGVWRHDLDALDAALARASEFGQAVLVLCNPWNPVGRALTGQEQLAIAEVVARHGAIVFSDEIHAPLRYDGVPHVPYASLTEATAQHTITAISASKTWNLPGLKCAQLIATARGHREVLASPSALAGYEAATIGAIANAAAYDDGEPWRADALVYLDENRRTFADAVERLIPGAQHTPPEATYLAWVDLRGVMRGEGRELPEDLGAFLREAGVAITDGAACGAPGFIRFNLALPRPLLIEAVERIATALA